MSTALLSERFGALTGWREPGMHDGAFVVKHDALLPVARNSNLLALPLGPYGAELHVNRRPLGHAGTLRANGAHLRLGLAFHLDRHDREVADRHHVSLSSEKNGRQA